MSSKSTAQSATHRFGEANDLDLIPGPRRGSSSRALGERSRPAAVTLIVAPLPPPMGGAAKNTKIIVDRCHPDRLVVLNTSIGRLSHARDLGYHARRLWRSIATAVAILRHRDGAMVYVVPDGGLGLAYTTLAVLAARLKGYQCLLHHRTFRYIERRTLPMDLILRLLGRDGRHVFLCPSMQEGLVTTYRRQLQGRIVSNAAVLAPTPFRSPIPGRPVVLGHLSNLCVEKGIREVVESFLRLHRAGLDVNFHLAGGFADAEAEVLVGRARKVLGDRLVLWGPISGECKDAFYQNLDIFLFPTRFTLEAQPNVVFEAMQGSNAVIAFARGCIPSMLARGGGRVVPRDGDFAGVVEHLVAAWITERDTLEAVRRAAWESAMVQRAEALEAFDALIRHLNQEEVTQASLSPLASPVSPADHRTEQLP